MIRFLRVAAAFGLLPCMYTFPKAVRAADTRRSSPSSRARSIWSWLTTDCISVFGMNQFYTEELPGLGRTEPKWQRAADRGVRLPIESQKSNGGGQERPPHTPGHFLALGGVRPLRRRYMAAMP